MAVGVRGLPVTNSRVDGLMADFAGLDNLEKIVQDTLERLSLEKNAQSRANAVKSGEISIEELDVWFAEVVRKELGKTLGIVRANAMKKVPAGARSACSAILRRQYKDEYAGNINIATSKKRISFKKRIYPTPTGGKSGILRPRHVSSRTKSLYEYYGPDRGFILRFLEFGTDVRTAKTFGPKGKGSTATYGNRGSIGARSFFGSAEQDMKQAAAELGTTLINYVENWVEKKINESE